jgi:hypothetical protein
MKQVHTKAMKILHSGLNFHMRALSSEVFRIFITTGEVLGIHKMNYLEICFFCGGLFGYNNATYKKDYALLCRNRNVQPAMRSRWRFSCAGEGNHTAALQERELPVRSSWLNLPGLRTGTGGLPFCISWKGDCSFHEHRLCDYPGVITSKNLYVLHSPDLHGSCTSREP